jgi:hypothetical protein
MALVLSARMFRSRHFANARQVNLEIEENVLVMVRREQGLSFICYTRVVRAELFLVSQAVSKTAGNSLPGRLMGETSPRQASLPQNLTTCQQDVFATGL